MYKSKKKENYPQGVVTSFGIWFQYSSITYYYKYYLFNAIIILLLHPHAPPIFGSLRSMEER